MPIVMPHGIGDAVSGYAATFGTLSRRRDVCERGCFDESLAVWRSRGAWPRLRWKHGMYGIGEITGLRVDDYGLRVTARLWRGIEKDMVAAHSALRSGRPLGMSASWYVEQSERRGGVLHILRADIEDEISITPMPVDPYTFCVISRASSEADDELWNRLRNVARDVQGLTHTGR